MWGRPLGFRAGKKPRFRITCQQVNRVVFPMGRRIPAISTDSGLNLLLGIVSKKRKGIFCTYHVRIK
jgi:hypothetical protein